MHIYACDFETTVYDGQINTEVWSAAIAPLDTDEDVVYIEQSIDGFFKWCRKQHQNMRLYFHNLKFDGEFILSYLLSNSKYQSVTTEESHDRKVKNNEYSYLISSKGQFYCMKIGMGGKTIEIYNSYLLLPYSLERIGKSFGTKHKKLTMEYKGFRYAGCPISDIEKEYIKNDVLVLKEALNIMFANGHDKMSIGACCLSEFKKGLTYDPRFYPNMYEEPVPGGIPYETAGNYIHKAYYGGWTYLRKDKALSLRRNGFTVDANSLYPSVMHSKSGNRYPVGKPSWFIGEIPKFLCSSEWYYFVRIRCSFSLKSGYLPFIQIKNNLRYRSTECLETSAIFDINQGEYYDYIINENFEYEKVTVELTLTGVDFTRFLEHYDVEYEVLDGCYFKTEIGIFDEYIDRYYEQKATSKGAKREEAKLFMNNLYGKLAASPDSSYKVAYLDDKGVVKYRFVKENKKKPGYIPCGAAITSYARDCTIRAAQRNYDGFIYADTDSLHCDMPVSDLKGIDLHDSAICCWKLESEWEYGWFVRKKTYIEFDKFYHQFNLTCAGMPTKAKFNFLDALNGDMHGIPKSSLPYLTINDFKPGLRVMGKLMPKRYPGGLVLTDTEYTMRAGG